MPRLQSTFESLAFGALVQRQKDHLYWFGPAGFIYTSPWVVTPATTRQAGVLLLSATRRPLGVTAGGQRLLHEAVAVAPQVRRGLEARDAGLVSVSVFPPHPLYARFVRIASPGTVPLDLAATVPFAEALLDAHEGRLRWDEARTLFDEVVQTMAGQLPPAPAVSVGTVRLHERLLREPQCTLGELARELGLSYSGTSRHFSRAVGLSFRSYGLWLKYYLASDHSLRGASWTEAACAAGFSDSSHLARTWQASFGLTPSYTNDPEDVEVHRQPGQGWPMLRPPVRAA